MIGSELNLVYQSRIYVFEHSDVECFDHIILHSVEVQVAIVEDVDRKVAIQVGRLDCVVSFKVVMLHNQTAKVLLHERLVQVRTLRGQ